MKLQLMNVQRQHETYAEEYEKAALSVLRSGGYIGGENVSKFEEEFASYNECKYGISCGNGTDALVLALRALGIGKGDEVITVSFTFFATAESVAAVGAKPVFIDVLPDTYCMNPALIEKAITLKTKAVLPVHIYGNCCDMDSIRAICKKHNLYLITDCAQSAGTKYKGARKNALGDVSCFSFFPTKNLGCDGDGGMVITDDEDIARACRSLKVHGSGKDGLWTLKRQYKMENKEFPSYIKEGESKYYNYLIGYNSRLDAIQAAILRRKLTHLDEFVEARRSNAESYNKALKETSYIVPVEADGAYHSYYIYALKHPNAQVIMEKLKEAGVPCGTYYPVPVHLQGAFAELGYKEGDFPVTEDLCRTTFAIPVFPELYDEEREYIIDSLRKAFGELNMNYALIGCGRIAVNHIKAMRNNNLNLVALCDLKLDNIETLLSKTEYVTDAPRYTDYKKMIEEHPEIELVAIATDSGVHAEIALFCIDSGKHVIVEKPMAMSMKDATEMIKRSEEKRVKLGVCHQNRFNIAVQEMHNAVEKGRFGRLSHGSINVRWNRNKAYYEQAPWRGKWASDGGSLMNQCIHGIDLLRWMMGDEVDEVYGVTRQRLHDYLECEDIGMALLKFKNGAIGTVEGTVNVYPKNLEETLYLFGENGTVKLGGTSCNNIDVWNFVGTDDSKAGLQEETSNVYGNGHTSLYADVIEAIETNRKPYVDGYAGRNALEIVLAIYKSQLTGLPVKLPLEDFASTDMAGMFGESCI